MNASSIHKTCHEYLERGVVLDNSRHQAVPFIEVDIHPVICWVIAGVIC